MKKNKFQKIKKYQYLITIAVVLIILALVLIITLWNNSPSVEFESGKKINLEVAKTYQEKALGLMNRTSLNYNSGMLFIFEKESNQSFWMQNTLIPLDIIFIDADYKIVSIKTMQPCSTKPCQTYSSDFPIRYAIEVNAGFTADNQILVGQKVKLK